MDANETFRRVYRTINNISQKLSDLQIVELSESADKKVISKLIQNAELLMAAVRNIEENYGERDYL